MKKSGYTLNHTPTAELGRQNVARAANAYRAITAFRHAAGVDMGAGIEAAISELLFSLAHLADREGCDFAAALLCAKRHYERATTATRAGESSGAQFERIHIEWPPL